MVDVWCVRVEPGLTSRSHRSQRVAEVLGRYGQLTLKDLVAYCGKPPPTGATTPLSAPPVVLTPELVRLRGCVGGPPARTRLRGV